MNTPSPPKRRRRWLRFSLRTLLILVTIFGIWIGWKMYLRREQQRVLDAVHARGGTTTQLLPDLSFLSRVQAPWTQNNVVSLANLKLTDDELKDIGTMPYLVGLHLADNQITDRGLAHLQNQTDLRVLDLTNNPAITDAGLAELKDLTELESLTLRKNSRITDAGLVHLENMQKLDLLILFGTSVTPEGVSRLQKKLTKTRIGF